MRGTSPLARGLVLSALVCVAGGSAPAQVTLSEILASNRFTSFDEDGDSEDWAEIHNAGAVAVDLVGYGLSDDGTALRKWIFPSVTIPPDDYLIVWLSGKDRFLPPHEAIAGGIASVPFEASLIAAESEWEYLVGVPGAVGPPAGWNLLGASGDGFSFGRSGFGYGDEDDTTEVPAGTTAIFTRKTFHVRDPSSIESLILEIDYDDGFVAYLNGTRVASANAPSVHPTFSSVATGSREAGRPERFDLSPHLALLLPGDNLLAVVGLNVGSGSTDMSLHPVLGVVPMVLHTSFSLERDGEALILTDPEGTIIDGALFGPQTEDHSYGRLPGDRESWHYLLTPTPGAPNLTQGFDEPISSEVAFDRPPGKYPGPIQVAISATPDALVEIRYTTDGSSPSPQSALYSTPLPLLKDTVIRAAAFIGGERSTRVVSKSYFIASGIRLPILSISMEPAAYAEIHNNASGRGRAWERPAFMEYFEANGDLAVATGMGLRLHGGAGRGGDFETKKAYKAYFRGEYGDKKLNCRIIPDTPVESFDKLVLRSGFNDCFRTNGRAAYIRDQLIRDLHEDMGALVSHGSWCSLYVNMKYRGLFNIVERMDEDFLSSYHEGDDWDVIKTGNEVLVGSIDEWNRLRNFMVSNDLSVDAAYEQGIRLLDLENFTGYMILNMWAQNHDWPHNNWYAARERKPDGKWIFLSWDAEFGIGLIPQGYGEDSFAFTLTRGGYIREIFEGLLENAGYRAYFLREVERHLEGALYPDNVLARIRRLRDLVSPDMGAECVLFGRTLDAWRSNLAAMETFAAGRGAVFLRTIQNSTLYDFPVDRTPVLTEVVPPSVVNVGGVEVSVKGQRISLATQFTFDGLPAEGVRYMYGRILVKLPFTDLLVGPVTITATNPDTGEAGDYDGLLEVILPTPRVDAILPESGSALGGDTVTIRGDHFLEGIEVFFGDAPASEVVRVEGRSNELRVLTPPGSGPVPVKVVNRIPRELVSEAALTFTYRGTRFIRGDANVDGSLDISDPLAVLGFLFLGEGELPCHAAADANASLEVDLSDAIAILGHLFLGTEPPPAPFPACAFDPDPAGLPCERGPGC